MSTGLTGYDVDTVYSYDVYDRISQKSTVNQLFNRYAAKSGQTLNVSYGYSMGGKPSSMTLPSGRNITYSYTATGMLSSINLNGSALIRNITHDGANRITAWWWGASGGARYIRSYNYNNIGTIDAILNYNQAETTNYVLTHRYDADGRVTTINRNTGTIDNYVYDAANRLKSESRHTNGVATYSISYGYDKNGNRISLSATGQHLQPAANASYAYSGNKLASFSKNNVAQSISHTANAELNYGTYLPAYDNGGRRKVDRLNTNNYYDMNYNHKNERSYRGYVVNGAVSTMTQYIYDEDSHLIGEYNKNGVQVEYVWLGDIPVAAIYGSGTNTKIYYIVTDAQNTPRRLIDSVSHAVAWSWDSTAFGLGNPVGTVTFNLRFPGQYYDAATGQFYNHNRYYNPELGRYMEADPIGLEGGLNPYAYAGNNPVMNVDPSGLYSFDLTPAFNNQLSNIFERTASRTALGWGAAVVEPSPFGEIIMGVTTIGIAGYETYKNFSVKDYVTSSGIKIELNKNYPEDRFIFRSGSGTNMNLTPREVDVGGLSYSLAPPSQNYTFTTLSTVNSTGILKAVVDNPRHVSVFPVNQATMKGWIATRGNAEKSPHPYTLLLKSISLKRAAGEQP
ncbi:hypothetical protein GCM10023206_31550 [Acinetobacter puyangensis]|uniref:RHS repeat-associated core domain-containing protein n=1 Tax=Acinetobacter puyangensis TaxID=1096779 RepID=A0A240E4F0_9GAMM|nr:RHS repeat-associated core domain-containing protein [Acinetobacter puyangensis]SNX43079.1 RHS repeat-associated core domain-containing protein [Acinetobacter puyangensis]